MANKKISQLSSLSTLTGKEEIPVAYNGDNYKITPDNIRDGLATRQEVDQRIEDIIGTAPEALDTLGEIADKLKEGDEALEIINEILQGKASVKDLEELKKELEEDADDTIALIVKLHAVITASASPATIYKGENTNVVFNSGVTFDGKPLTYALTVDGNPLANPYSLNDSKTFALVFNINNADPKLVTSISRSVTVNAYYPRYYGRVNKETLTSEDVLKLEKQSVAANATLNNKTITSSEADYLWLCVPSTMSVTTVTSGGFAVPMESPVNVEVSGKGTYKCYRSTNKANAGSVTYNIA